MTKNDILTRMATEKFVEKIVMSVTHSSSLTASLEDLCQYMYLYLCTTPEAKLRELWNGRGKNGQKQMSYWVTHLVKAHLGRGKWHSEFVKHSEQMVELNEEIRIYETEDAAI